MTESLKKDRVDSFIYTRNVFFTCTDQTKQRQLRLLNETLLSRYVS